LRRDGDLNTTSFVATMLSAALIAASIATLVAPVLVAWLAGAHARSVRGSGLGTRAVSAVFIAARTTTGLVARTIAITPHVAAFTTFPTVSTAVATPTQFSRSIAAHGFRQRRALVTEQPVPEPHGDAVARSVLRHRRRRNDDRSDCDGSGAEVERRARRPWCAGAGGVTFFLGRERFEVDLRLYRQLVADYRVPGSPISPSRTRRIS
jgi:hypothetical protein